MSEQKYTDAELAIQAIADRTFALILAGHGRASAVERALGKLPEQLRLAVAGAPIAFNESLAFAEAKHQACERMIRDARLQEEREQIAAEAERMRALRETQAQHDAQQGITRNLADNTIHLPGGRLAGPPDQELARARRAAQRAAEESERG